MFRFLYCTLLFAQAVICCGQGILPEKKEKTSFQTSAEWKARTDVRSDVAIVYGTRERKNMTFEQRVQTWRDKGYTVHFMTGIAWGDYADYFNGDWDDKNHWDDGQVRLGSNRYDTVWHHPGVPYIVPSASFLEYMKEKHVKRAIDAGIDAIYLEEPEFWAKSGYSASFKREWEKFYGFPWRPQHESPQNTYLANKLKYQLYYDALNEVFTFAKEYGKSKGMDIRCYVPTHSLLNYSSWEIVSPEASLASLPCVDGYIGQIWTGTARTANYFNGIRKERTFETAFIEYNCMESMVRPTQRKVIFLTDPIEDRARDWADYKLNYQATFAAMLLFPKVDNYEVMPWPDRIYEGLYTNPKTGKKEPIPKEYATQMQVMVNTLNTMPLTGNRVSGSHGIGVMMANSLMFQRFPVHQGYDDPAFSNFFGQVLPLLKRGIPVDIVHIENTPFPLTWKDLKVLILSYSNMKPMKEEYHHYIADWVKAGGMLIYCGSDTDPFQQVMEWWNTGKWQLKAPSCHLFSVLGIPEEAPEGVYRAGKGNVYVLREDPKEFVMKAGNDRRFFETVCKAFGEYKKGEKPEIKNSFYLERGPYVIVSVIDESPVYESFILKGLYIDLFDPELPVLTEKKVAENNQAFVYDLKKIPGKGNPQVLCGASRIYDESREAHRYLFTAKSPQNTVNVSRIYLPRKPEAVTLKNSQGEVFSPVDFGWDDTSKTCLLKFDNSPEGVRVEICF